MKIGITLRRAAPMSSPIPTKPPCQPPWCVIPDGVGVLGALHAQMAQRPRPSPLASVTSALPVSITGSIRFGNASMVRF